MKRSIRGRLAKVLVAFAMVQSVVGLSASPASASASLFAQGDIMFEGDASLSKFPCDSSTGTCVGLFKGMWEGTLEGVYEDDTFVIHWRTVPTDVNPDAGRVHVQFDYNETFCPNQVPQAGAVSGTASGGGTARAGTSEVVGTIWDNITGLPSTIDSITMNFSFDWVRVGNGAALDFYWVQFIAEVDGFNRTLVDTPQLGTADFVLTDPGTPVGVPNCTSPSYNVKGQIAGHASIIHDPV